MKLTNRIIGQLILTKNQINKNKKLSHGYIRDKTYNPITHPKSSLYYSFDILKREKKNVLNSENKLFLDLYRKTKELYPTKIKETFKDLINQYKNNNYIIPDLSDKKNLFKQNPLILEGHELEQFYKCFNTTNANNSNEKNIINKNDKHVDFIKKEMFMLENIVYNRSNGNYDKNKELYNESYGSNYKTNEIGKKNHEFNYFQVDNIWDKIKREKDRMKQEKINRIRNLKKNLMKGPKDKKLEINISDNNKKKTNLVHKSTEIDIDKRNSLTSAENNKNSFNATTNNYNNKESITFKNINSMSTEYNNKTRISFNKLKTKYTNQSSIPKKVKFKLLKIEEKNKILKDIESIKSTLDNKDLMEKNITIEEYKEKKRENKTINLDKVLGKYLFDENTNKNMRLSKFFSQRLKRPMLMNIFGHQAIKINIFKKLNKETDPKKIIEIYMNLNLDIFNQNEIEKLIKIYYQKILGRNEESINKILKLQLGDVLICELLDKYVNKSKEKLIKYSTKTKVNRSLNNANKQILALKRRYLMGKTFDFID